MPAARQVWLAVLHWPIEQCFRDGQQLFGVGDDYEDRSSQGWHRHAMPTMPAHFFVVREVLRLQKAGIPYLVAPPAVRIRHDRLLHRNEASSPSWVACLARQAFQVCFQGQSFPLQLRLEAGRARPGTGQQGKAVVQQLPGRGQHGTEHPGDQFRGLTASRTAADSLGGSRNTRLSAISVPSSGLVPTMRARSTATPPFHPTDAG